MTPTETLLPQLQAACTDLLWQSESDYPFEVICWSLSTPTLDGHDLLYTAGYALDTPVQVITLDDFFRAATLDRAWHDSSEKARVDRYRHLKDLLETSLAAPQGYRIGEIDIAVYLIGKTEEGQFVGVKTTVIET